eukprot:8863398-Alexandrium_andersonii.AAC.1
MRPAPRASFGSGPCCGTLLLPAIALPPLFLASSQPRHACVERRHHHDALHLAGRGQHSAPPGRYSPGGADDSGSRSPACPGRRLARGGAGGARARPHGGAPR